MKKIAVSILFLLVFFALTENCMGQFETKKTRFKSLKSYLFHNPFEIGVVQFNTRIKVGYGIPQGILGVNAEFGIDYLTVTAGLGYAKMRNTTGALGYALGLRGYFIADDKNLRPRLSAHYGLVNIYNEKGKNTAVYGPSLGIGFEHKLTDFIVYDLEYTFLLNFLNSYRPLDNTLENVAIPQVGIGVYF